MHKFTKKKSKYCLYNAYISAKPSRAVEDKSETQDWKNIVIKQLDREMRDKKTELRKENKIKNLRSQIIRYTFVKKNRKIFVFLNPWSLILLLQTDADRQDAPDDFNDERISLHRLKEYQRGKIFISFSC